MRTGLWGSFWVKKMCREFLLCVLYYSSPLPLLCGIYIHIYVTFQKKMLELCIFQKQHRTELELSQPILLVLRYYYPHHVEIRKQRLESLNNLPAAAPPVNVKTKLPSSSLCCGRLPVPPTTVVQRSMETLLFLAPSRSRVLQLPRPHAEVTPELLGCEYHFVHSLP